MSSPSSHTLRMHMVPYHLYFQVSYNFTRLKVYMTYFFYLLNGNIVPVFCDKNQLEKFHTDFSPVSFSLLKLVEFSLPVGYKTAPLRRLRITELWRQNWNEIFPGPEFFFFFRLRSYWNCFWAALYLVAIMQKTKERKFLSQKFLASHANVLTGSSRNHSSPTNVCFNQ